jgi:predicted dehydrogenase
MTTAADEPGSAGCLDRSVTTLRLGLVGTGYWARVTHAPALSSTEGIQLTSVWGRAADAAAELAAAHGATAYSDFDAFLRSVDAVAFSVPPDIQAPLAIKAASAGKHLLLEKPVALTTGEADALVTAAENVATVVFFTARFESATRAWLAQTDAQQGWMGGSATWLGRALTESGPFNTAWRRAKGALWDVGPHAVSLLWATLGPVARVTADHGKADITHLILHHESGVTSTVTVTLSAPESAASFDLYLWGEPGKSALPPPEQDAVACLRTALTELAAATGTQERPRHPCGVSFGRDVVRVLSSAQAQLDAHKVHT